MAWHSQFEDMRQRRVQEEKKTVDHQAVVLKSLGAQQHELLQLQAAEVKVVFDSVEVKSSSM